MKKSIVLFLILCLLALLVPSSKDVTSDIMSKAEAIGEQSAMVVDVTKVIAAYVEEKINALDKELEALDNTKQGWGQGRQVDHDNRPVSAIAFQNKYGKYDAIYIEENANKIYLTFDEGYENGYTPTILDVLKERGIPAVFFVTYDYAKRNPDLVQRMIDEGHVVGNHSYTHASMPTLSIEKASIELTTLHNYIKENFNYTMTLFRPPMGEFSERTLALTQSLGYKSVFWSFAYVDWNTQKQMGADKAYVKVVSGLHNGAVYLLHAVSKDNAEILGAFIDEAEKKSYQFAKVS